MQFRQLVFLHIHPLPDRLVRLDAAESGLPTSAGALSAGWFVPDLVASSDQLSAATPARTPDRWVATMESLATPVAACPGVAPMDCLQWLAAVRAVAGTHAYSVRYFVTAVSFWPATTWLPSEHYSGSMPPARKIRRMLSLL